MNKDEVAQLARDFHTQVDKMALMCHKIIDDLIEKLEKPQILSVVTTKEIISQVKTRTYIVKDDLSDLSWIPEEEEEQLPIKKRSQSESDLSSFVQDDDKELSYYDMDELSVNRNRKRFVDESFEDNDVDENGDDCGSEEVTKNDLLALPWFLEQVKLNGLENVCNTNSWWQKTFGARLEGIKSNMGNQLTQSHVFASNVLTKIIQAIQDKKKVTVKACTKDNTKRNCGFCGLQKRCDYNIVIEDEDNIGLGSVCLDLAKSTIAFYQSLFNTNYDIKYQCERLKYFLHEMEKANSNKRSLKKKIKKDLPSKFIQVEKPTSISADKLDNIMKIMDLNYKVGTIKDQVHYSTLITLFKNHNIKVGPKDLAKLFRSIKGQGYYTNLIKI